MSKGIKMLGGKADRYLQILGMFCEDFRDRDKGIKTSLENNDLYLYKVHVHALKSSSAGIGATRLSEGAQLLEMAAEQGDMDFIEKNTDAVLYDLKELLDNIDRVLSADRGENQYE